MTNKNCGIYKITNTVTRKFYIGSAVNIKRRWAYHRSQLGANKHGNRHLQNSWNKHGEDSFTFEVLEYCGKERLIEREQFYIDNEKPAYNISPTAGSSLGVKHTDEAKRKISEANKGEKHAFYGKHHTDETKRKMSETNKGKVFSDETKRKISEANKGNQNRLGVKLTDDTKRKISEANKGYQNHLGVKHTDEAKRKMSKAKKGNQNRLGVKNTDETKRKISEAMKRYWAERLSNE